MSHLARLLLTVFVFASISCTNDQSSTSGPADDSETDRSEAVVDGDAGESAGEQAPIALTDASLDRYLAYRKEYNRLNAAWTKDAISLAKAVDSRSTDLGKAVTATAGATRLGEGHEKALRQLRAKHGVAADEDDRLWSAISDVVAASTFEHPATAAALQSLREAQAKGGDEGKMADETLKDLEREEKEALAAARASYGDACVDVLSRRVKELVQFHMDSMTEHFQTAAGESKPER